MLKPLRTNLLVKTFAALLFVGSVSDPAICETLDKPAETALSIVDITVVGNRLISDQDIRRRISTKPGDDFQSDRIKNDLKSIYKMGYFIAEGLQVKPIRKGSSGVSLIFCVNENPPVSEITLEGNKVFSDIRIWKVFADQLGRPENVKLLSYEIAELEREYEQEGLPLARVRAIKDDPEGALHLKIDEGTEQAHEAKSIRPLTGAYIVDFNDQQLAAGKLPPPSSYSDSDEKPWTLIAASVPQSWHLTVGQPSQIHDQRFRDPFANDASGFSHYYGNYFSKLGGNWLLKLSTSDSPKT